MSLCKSLTEAKWTERIYSESKTRLSKSLFARVWPKRSERSESIRKVKQDSANLSVQEFDRSEMNGANLFGKQNKIQQMSLCKSLTEAKWTERIYSESKTRLSKSLCARVWPKRNERSESIRKAKQDSANVSLQEFDRSEMNGANLFGKQNKTQQISLCKSL